jgi:hypothetical protein
MKDKNKKGKRSHRGMKYAWIEKIREQLNFGKKSKRKKAKKAKRKCKKCGGLKSYDSKISYSNNKCQCKGK